MRRWFVSVIGMAGMALTACSSLQLTSFDQLQAADVSFPEKVRRVAIVNNMPVVKAENNHEMVSAELEGDGKIAAEALAESIAEVDYFDQVVICDSALRAGDEVLRANVLLTKGEVQKLATDMGVDMLLSFDRIHIQTRPGVLLYPEFPIPIHAVDAALSPIVRVYVPGRENPLFMIAKQDTISWEMNATLSDEKIVKEASEYAASIPVEHLLPHWKEVTRCYYDGGTVEMRDAGVCLRENDWEGALALWQEAYTKKKGLARMRAAFNIALYYEVKDEVSTAREWLEKVRPLVKPGSKEEQLLTYYLLQLEDRVNQLSKLHMQMKRFEDNF